MKFDPDKHHRRSIRLRNFDYTSARGYFVTIVTHQRQSIFGKIENREINLNQLGDIARKQWLRLPSRFESLSLGLFVVMPNHIHGILQINPHPESDRGEEEQYGKPVKGSIPTIVRSYKSTVTKEIRLSNVFHVGPVWQRNYYEHVIRDQEDWHNIREYIRFNPLHWDQDDLFRA